MLTKNQVNFMAHETKKFIRYTERFKQQLVSEVLSGQGSKSSVSQKYQVRGAMTLDRWCKKYGGAAYKAGQYIDLPLSMRTEQLNGPPKEPLPDDVKILRQRIAELETCLASESLKREAFERFVEIAKRDHSVDLTKKSDTKQSPK
jgi:transposase-like protein